MSDVFKPYKVDPAVLRSSQRSSWPELLGAISDDCWWCVQESDKAITNLTYMKRTYAGFEFKSANHGGKFMMFARKKPSP